MSVRSGASLRIERPIEVDTEPRIHPTAVVHRSAEIAPTARIGAYSVIGPQVRIGDHCVLHNHVSVMERTTLGEACVLYPFAVLGAEPQDLKHKGEATELILGDRVRVREHATLHRGTVLGGGVTTVGDDCLLMVGVHVAHDCHIGDGVVIANAVMLGGHAVVEEGAVIAGGAGIHHFATVGRFAFVGGLARITKDVPPFLIVEGNPAEPRKVNTTALVRRGWASADIEALRSAFKALYRDETPVSVTIERLRAQGDQPRCVLELCDAIDRTRMGVHGRWREALRDPQAPRFARASAIEVGK